MAQVALRHRRLVHVSRRFYPVRIFAAFGQGDKGKFANQTAAGQADQQTDLSSARSTTSKGKETPRA